MSTRSTPSPNTFPASWPSSHWLSLWPFHPPSSPYSLLPALERARSCTSFSFLDHNSVSLLPKKALLNHSFWSSLSIPDSCSHHPEIPSTAVIIPSCPYLERADTPRVTPLPVVSLYPLIDPGNSRKKSPFSTMRDLWSHPSLRSPCRVSWDPPWVVD